MDSAAQFADQLHIALVRLRRPAIAYDDALQGSCVEVPEQPAKQLHIAFALLGQTATTQVGVLLCAGALQLPLAEDLEVISSASAAEVPVAVPAAAFAAAGATSITAAKGPLKGAFHFNTPQPAAAAAAAAAVSAKGKAHVSSKTKQVESVATSASAEHGNMAELL